MARQPKTPSTPAKRGKNTADSAASAVAPAKTRARHAGRADQQREQHSIAGDVPGDTLTPDVPGDTLMPEVSGDAPIQEQTFEAPTKSSKHAEPQPAAAAEAGREDRASRALDAIKTLSEMIAEGIGALSELRAEMQQMSGRLDQLAAIRPEAAQAKPDSTANAADNYHTGRDHDPGDAVPPGVAVMSPTPLTELDKTALHSLEELPKRAGRGKRGPRTKA